MRSEKKVMQMDSMDFVALLNDCYELVESEWDCKYVQADLKAKCHNYGRLVDVHRFAFFDKANFKLYIYNFDRQSYRLDGEKIELIDNGSDNILFQHDSRFEKYEIGEPSDESLLNYCLIGKINFSDKVDTTLDALEQKILFHIWLLSIFFESILPTKPIALLLGVKGSGKTFVAKMVGKLLFSEGFNVNSITTMENFDAVIANSYLVAYDNVDVNNRWLNDRLATVSTGMVIEKRKLYTTNQSEKYHPRCFLALTARTPEFKRDDVVERLLIFRVQRIENFTSERLLMENLMDNRNKILSELFQELNICVRKLKENQNERYEGTHRMADFADLIFKISDKNNQLIQILNKMSQQQTEFLYEDDPLIQCLQIWLQKSANRGTPFIASDLLKDIEETAKTNGITIGELSSVGLGKKLNNEAVNLKEFFKFTIHKPKGAPNQYEFNVK